MNSARSSVEAHYTGQDLARAIPAALKAAGKDIDHLTPDDLAPVDEFHGGQRPATIRLAELVGFTGTERVRARHNVFRASGTTRCISRGPDATRPAGGAAARQ